MRPIAIKPAKPVIASTAPAGNGTAAAVAASIVKPSFSPLWRISTDAEVTKPLKSTTTSFSFQFPAPGPKVAVSPPADTVRL